MEATDPTAQTIISADSNKAMVFLFGPDTEKAQAKQAQAQTAGDAPDQSKQQQSNPYGPALAALGGVGVRGVGRSIFGLAGSALGLIPGVGKYAQAATTAGSKALGMGNPNYGHGIGGLFGSVTDTAGNIVGMVPIYGPFLNAMTHGLSGFSAMPGSAGAGEPEQ